MIRVLQRHPDAVQTIGVEVPASATSEATRRELEAFVGPNLMLEWGRLVLVTPDGTQRTYLDPGDWIVQGVGVQTGEWDYYVIRSHKRPRVWEVV